MLPGSSRDAFVSIAKIAFPVAAAVLALILVILPLSMQQEFSFLLSKDSAMKSDERMRTQEASYRGETARGEPFRISAESGVQKSSTVPIVILTGLKAEIDRADGPATVTAPRGEFLIEENRVVVHGPIVARSASGFSLDGELITVDINSSRVQSSRPVKGTIPMGRFSAGNFDADINGRHVVLDGRVSMRITPNRQGL